MSRLQVQREYVIHEVPPLVHASYHDHILGHAEGSMVTTFLRYETIYVDLPDGRLDRVD